MLSHIKKYRTIREGSSDFRSESVKDPSLDRHRLPPVAQFCYIFCMKHINHKVAYSEPCGIYKAICMENPAFELTDDGRMIYHPELDTTSKGVIR